VVVNREQDVAGSSEDTTTIGELLSTHRRRIGLTQRELAERAELSVGAVRDIEQGRSGHPRQSSVQAMATALDLDPTALAALRAMLADTAPEQRPNRNPVASEPVQIKVLGSVELWHGDTRTALGSTMQHLLLARLAISTGQPVGRDELVDLLWKQEPPDEATKLLRTHIARLRRLLGPSGTKLIAATHTGYRLEVTPDQLDLLQFRALARQAESVPPEAAFALLLEAVGLWRGDPDLDELQETPSAAAITDEYVAVLRQFAAVARDVGRPERALGPLRRLAARLELNEPLHAELIITLAASGRQAEALAAYERIRAHLADQLGLDPGQELRETHLGVLRQGWHLSEARARPVIQQVPAAPSGFVGRSDEFSRIAASLARPESDAHESSSRLVLVHGPAGIGKTAFAHAASTRLRPQYPDGQLYADLGGSSGATVEAMTVLDRFLRTLGVPGHQVGRDLDEAASHFRSELADRRMLVVLDNARDADQVRHLLPGTGRSDVLVTSRHLIRGLDAAAVIGLGALSPAESVDLIAFVTGRDRTGVDGSAASELGAACGHLPLALRIAAGRLASRPSWAVSDLAHRLRDENGRLAQLDDGTSSVLVSFQLSYDRLDDSARRAFRLASVHPGEDFGVPATAALLDVDLAAAERLLDELLDANVLLQYSPDRFRFHDLLRLYSRRLAGGGDERNEAEEALDRLMEWYAELVTAAMEWVYPQLVRLGGHPERERWFDNEPQALDWLDMESGTLIRLVEQAADDERRASFAWTVSDQLRGYFLIRRHLDGWTRVAEAGWRAAAGSPDLRVRVAALLGRGQALSAVGRDAEALDVMLEAQSMAERCAWGAAAAYLAHNVGWQYFEFGMPAEADTWFGKAFELTMDDPQGHVRAASLNGSGMVQLDRGSLDKAAEQLGAALAINEAAGRESSALANRGNLASALRRRGDLDEAARHLDVALQGYRRRGDVRGELSTLDELSLLATDHEDHPQALNLARQAYELALRVNDNRARVMTACTLGDALRNCGDIAGSVDHLRTSADIAVEHSFTYFEARAQLGLARSLHLRGDDEPARLAAERARTIAHERGYTLLAAAAEAAAEAAAAR
jgi:DNA-binding SARP family transcriptional activator/tetratricopeptide (TPR) repeat protein/DNA-binding XRE family transcriptional regulator